MRKAKLFLFALCLSLVSFGLTAQTFNGGGGLPIPASGTGGFNCAGGPTLSTATSTAVGEVGTDIFIESVAIDLNHTFNSDLIITLISPTGEELDLANGNGGASDNFLGTVFTDTASVTINIGTGPFTGFFLPAGGGLNSVLAGADAAGDWTLQICDEFGGDSGTLNSWSITLSGDAPEVGNPFDVGYGIKGGNDQLLRVDLVTGVVDSVATMVPNPPGFRSGGEVIGDQLFYTSVGGGGDGFLWSTNITDGVSTQLFNLNAFEPDGFTSFEVDPTTGTLYGISTDISSTTLYTIDVAGSTATLVGTSTIGGGISLTIDMDGNAYILDLVGDAIFPVDLSTGQPTGPGVPLTNANGTGLDINFGQNTDFDCNDDGSIYGIIFDNGLFDNRFGVLDPETGVFSDRPFSDTDNFANYGVFGIECGDRAPDGSFEVNLSAINSINVTLEEDCMAKLSPRMVLVGDYDVDGDGIEAPEELFEVIVQDEDPSNGMVIDGCGTYIWTINPAVPDTILIGFTSAWGFVNAEDKTSPVVDALPEAPEELFCSELDMVNINELASSISRCWIADGTSFVTLNSSMDVRLRDRLIAGGGVPRFFDGCSDVQICVNDIVSNDGNCEDVVITRVFTATDGLSCTSVSGEENAPTVASYEIVFTNPSLDDVVGVPEEATFSCSDFDASDPNPLPEADDFPFLQRASGPVFLGTSFCNIGATYEDGPRITTCDNTYKFVRTFTVIDWCDVEDVRTYTQLVKVGDFEAPTITAPTQDLDFDGNPDDGPLFFSTNSLDCTAFIDILAGVSADDNCDEDPTIIAFVFPFGDLSGAPLGPFDGSVLAGGFPLGDHIVRYVAVDNCGNEDFIEVDITIGDRTAPVAICEDGLNISIGGDGTAVVCAEDINRASYDECSDILLEIARVGDDNQPLPGEVYRECITLTCDELGIVRVGLRVTDDGNRDGNFTFGVDNSNYCWLDVLVEDKAAPICVAPASLQVTCQDLDGDFPADLNALFAADPEGTSALLDAEFGNANGIDNCPEVTITQTVVDNRTSCGTGTITRRFTVTDGQGFTSPANACNQLITVLGVHDYTVVFPGDEESDDCIEPDYSAVTFEERGCDLITVSTSIDTFTATADECYKLRITYEVLNWCEYNTEDDPYIIPRDADNDNILEEDTWLHVIPREVNTLTDDLAFLDRDNNRTNANTIANLDTGDGGVVPGTSGAGYGLDGSRGAYLYRQFIKVYDDTPPTLTTVTPDGGFCDLDGDCQDDAELGFSISDECSPSSVDATVQLDAFIDAGDDEIYTLADFVADGGDVTDNVTNNGDGSFTVNLSDLPLGRHAIRIVATDGCGNTAIDLIEFEIIDCKAPTPICINGLTATLMPDGEGGGMAAIWASDFIASPSFDCAGVVEFSIYTSEEASQAGFEPAIGDVGIDLTCADLGMLPVRIYAIDPNGQSDYCETTVFVQAFQDGVCAGGEGSLAGVIATPNSDMMTGVEVNISDAADMNATEFTTNGVYQFQNLPLGEDYTVQPAYDPAVNLATVSTGDLILISRHILGLQELTGDYQLLAADVTLEGSINVLDIIAIRRVILGLDASFESTASWQFYVAGDDTYQQVYNANNLPGDITGADFVAVEMGNVSDAIANFQAPVQQRSALGLNVEDQDLVAGNVYEVTFSAAEMAGFQGTLEIAAGLELVDVNYALVEAGNFNLSQAANGLVAMSYNGEAGELFTLNVRATVDAKLSDMVSISDRITVAEAYTNGGGIANLGINFSAAPTVAAEFGLEQNTPNPFADVTQIGFRLPAAGQATLTVQDVQGRTLLVRQLEGNAGYNTTDLNTADLKGATGVLSYTIVAGDFTATRKMVVVQ